jgi:hypothetical protein
VFASSTRPKLNALLREASLLSLVFPSETAEQRTFVMLLCVCNASENPSVHLQISVTKEYETHLIEGRTVRSEYLGHSAERDLRGGAASIG